MATQPAILTLFKEQLENESTAIAKRLELTQRGHQADPAVLYKVTRSTRTGGR